MEHARLTGHVHRVISVSLTEADWEAFLKAAPQPVHWLQARIQEAIATQRDAGGVEAAGGATWRRV